MGFDAWLNNIDWCCLFTDVSDIEIMWDKFMRVVEHGCDIFDPPKLLRRSNSVTYPSSLYHAITCQKATIMTAQASPK